MLNILKSEHVIKEPSGLSDRIQWFRDYYFRGTERVWNNEFTSWTTQTPWDIIYNELTFYIVPETYPLLDTLGASYLQAARPVALHPDFWNWSLPERRAWFVRDMIVNYVPQEILPGDLVAGARFNVQTSLCLTREEGKAWQKLVKGKNGARSQMKWFHDHGYGNAGATSGHLIPGHERLLAIGSKGVHAELMSIDNAPGNQERNGSKGDQLRAMITASTMARDLASKYKILCKNLAQKEPDAQREAELRTMAANLSHVPWEPATTSWEAVQALWTHLKKEGREYEVYNQQPMFRYNTYFGINTVHYLDLKETTAGAPLPIASIIPSALLTKMKKSSAAKNHQERVLSFFGEALFNRLDSHSFLSYIDRDGFPVIIPVIQCQASDPSRLAFHPGAFSNELGLLESGMTVAVFGLTMQMEDVLVRGIFNGYDRYRGIKLGTLDMDWVYNSMPPNHGQIYPMVPLEAVVNF